MGLFKPKELIEEDNTLTPHGSKYVRKILHRLIDGLTPEQIDNLYQAACRSKADNTAEENPTGSRTPEEVAEKVAEETTEAEKAIESDGRDSVEPDEPSPLTEYADKISKLECHLDEMIKTTDCSFGIAAGHVEDNKDPQRMTYNELKAYLTRTGDIR